MLVAGNHALMLFAVASALSRILHFLWRSMPSERVSIFVWLEAASFKMVRRLCKARQGRVYVIWELGKKMENAKQGLGFDRIFLGNARQRVSAVRMTHEWFYDRKI